MGDVSDQAHRRPRVSRRSPEAEARDAVTAAPKEPQNLRDRPMAIDRKPMKRIKG